MCPAQRPRARAPAEPAPQVPQSYIDDNYPPGPLRSVINGMSSFLDEATKNVTDALRDAGMWDDTLLVLSTDAPLVKVPRKLLLLVLPNLAGAEQAARAA